MSSKSKKTGNKKKQEPPQKPAKGGWDFAIFAAGRLANLADKNPTGCLLFVFGLCACIICYRWPQDKFYELKALVENYLLIGSLSANVVFMFALKLHYRLSRGRIEELSTKVRVFEEEQIKGRISSRIRPALPNNEQGGFGTAETSQ